MFELGRYLTSLNQIGRVDRVVPSLPSLHTFLNAADGISREDQWDRNFVPISITATSTGLQSFSDGSLCTTQVLGVFSLSKAY